LCYRCMEHCIHIQKRVILYHGLCSLLPSDLVRMLFTVYIHNI
jgi:hypothetical protein